MYSCWLVHSSRNQILLSLKCFQSAPPVACRCVSASETRLVGRLPSVAKRRVSAILSRRR